MNYPRHPQCSLGQLQPVQMDREQIKRQGWQEDGILVVDISDDRLTNFNRDMMTEIGNRLYGGREVKHG